MTESPTLRENSAATRSDDVYGQLRTRIISGVLRPNERLVEAELADQLRVSRTPVRESLQRLSADGLIVSRRRGWVVREHTRDEVVQIYEVRSALEGMAAKLAAERASTEELLTVRSTLDAMNERLDLGPTNRGGVVEANHSFHESIYLVAGNARLVAQIQSNRDFYFNHRVASLYTDEEMQASWDEHESIVKALLARDGDEAERLTREHLSTALKVTVSKLAFAGSSQLRV